MAVSRRSAARLLLLAACACYYSEYSAGVNAKTVTISNVAYRTNTTGDIMDAHDGSYNQWAKGEPWYYYAMGYGTCKQEQDLCNGSCGYGYSWIGIWKSDDMSNGSWSLVREARDDTWPDCIYFRVHTIYNNHTQLYVMWVNLNKGPADYAIGTSSSPEGPFTHSHNVNVGCDSHSGDFDLLVDDDGKAYIIYTCTHIMQKVELLRDDYLSSAAGPTPPPRYAKGKLPIMGTSIKSVTTVPTTSTAVAMNPIGGSTASNVSSGVIGLYFVEAPVFFKRNNIYYALFGNCCCFCGQGSGIGVYTAKNPLGPFTYHDNVGCLANTTLTSGCGCGMNHDTMNDTCSFYGDSLTKAQQNFVIRIPQADGSPDQFVWTGDRWQSAEDGIKAHDLQYWSVLEFAQGDDGIDVPLQFTWQDEIQINV